MRLLAGVLFALPAAFRISLAQTSTTCNPTTAECPADTALSSSTYSVDFTLGAPKSGWITTAGTVNYGSNGAEFTINKEGDSPTIETDFYIFFGQIEVSLKAANGTGIVSSIVMESDDLDEVDWVCLQLCSLVHVLTSFQEFTGTNTSSCETNYFGKGNTTTYDRAIYYPVTTPQGEFHNYTVNWTSGAITWSIDGTTVRTLAYADADGGANFPQTPMRVKLGIWAGGDPSNGQGTVEWAGGETDFSDAPFTMYVKSVTIENASPGSQYEYSDTTGAWTSIKVINGSTNSNNAVSISGSTMASSISSIASSSSTSGPKGTSSAGAASRVATSVSTSTSKGTSVASGAGSSVGAAQTSASSTATTSGGSSMSSQTMLCVFANLLFTAFLL